VHETSQRVLNGALDPRNGVVTPTGRALPYASPQSPLWYEQRRGGITATDLPKLLGVTDYGGPLHVWADKRGELPDDGVGEAGRWGTLLEDVVASEWATRERLTVFALGVLEHVDHPWQRASLDRLVAGCPLTGPDELCALEVKTRSAFVGGRWREQIPDDVYVQCAWQRIVSGLPHVHVAVLIGGQRLLTHRYDPDPGVEAQCLEAAAKAWQHVLAGEPPIVEPDDLLLDLLDRIHAERTGDVEVPGDLRPQAQQLVAERRRALAAAAQAKVDAERAKAGLVQLLGDGEVALADGVELFRYRPSTTRRTAWGDVVKAAPPDWRDDLQQLVAAHTRVTTSRSLILPDLPQTETPESTDAAA
jgi:putative phage-type endonuclease